MQKQKNEIEKNKEMEKMVNREDLNFRKSKCFYNSHQFEIVRSFARKLFGGKNYFE